MALNLQDIPGAFCLPRLKWDAIKAWVDSHVAEPDQGEAWTDIAAQWLNLLNEALGGAYQTLDGQNVRLFAPSSSPQAEPLLEYAELAIASLTDKFGDLARLDWAGPLVILLFADVETYYEYVSQFHAEREFAASAAMCIRHGYTHVVISPRPQLDALRSSAVHEITHSFLGHLELPPWLEEGITQNEQDEAIPGSRPLILTSESAQALREYWRTNALQGFWWGDSFHALDDGQANSYLLAHVLFRIIVGDHRKQLRDFVGHARVEDAGESAARSFLGMGLADLAAQFLGEGQWEPVPPDAFTFCRRGWWLAAQNDYDRALADLNEALRLAPDYFYALVNRAACHYQRQDYVAAVADYERAIELNADDFDARKGFAWILATCPDEKLRNGERAVELAHEACELTGYDRWECLGTLAAAQAEAGDFEEAVAIQKKSLRRAPDEERDGCKERLELYKAREPYREAGGHAPSPAVQG